MSAYTDDAGIASREVLVITDLSPASTNAVWRAALIAREQGAPLRLLHVGGERRRAAQVHAALEVSTPPRAPHGIVYAGSAMHEVANEAWQLAAREMEHVVQHDHLACNAHPRRCQSWESAVRR